jgi:hypothetical protein
MQLLQKRAGGFQSLGIVGVASHNLPVLGNQRELAQYLRDKYPVSRRLTAGGTMLDGHRMWCSG